MPFWTYLLHCRGGSFYTGHTDDLDRRIAEHQSGAFPGFTRDRLPVELVWSGEFPDRQQAFEFERRIKGWSRAKKLALIRGDWEGISRLARKKDGPSTGSGRAGFGLASGIEQKILGHARDAHPHECCGLLLGHGDRIEEIRPAANVHREPATHFEIDPQALLDAHRAARDGGPQVLGYYHSHPTTLPEPSATDRARAAGDGSIWAIVGEGRVTWWRDEKDGFAPLPYAVRDG
ncbi:Mov34/MPN/PAD-1 family protein [Erythrobacter sp. 3-20A1M]|uniref:Mov34/MPN/PAD-1 family protein n=1 Tax=Erythrobacter sp. 3-20A1M TaxID=2653850 RepID=UPI003530439F